jgi:hypothetical protein
VTPRGSLVLTGDAGTCALDVAREGEHTLDHVAGLLNLTGERTRQIEETAIAKLRGAFKRLGVELDDLTPPDGPQGEEQWPAPGPPMTDFLRELRLKMIERAWWKVRGQQARRERAAAMTRGKPDPSPPKGKGSKPTKPRNHTHRALSVDEDEPQAVACG